MKALSLWQPWASLIAADVKNYETRGWPPGARLAEGERFAICAAKTPASRIARDFPGAKAKDLAHLVRLAGFRCLQDMPRGVVLCTVRLGRVIKTEEWPLLPITEEICGDWSPGRYGWQLVSLHPCRFQVPVTGAQGVFELPAGVVDRLRIQGAA